MDAIIALKMSGFVFSVLCLLFSLLVLRNVRKNPRASACRVFLNGKVSFSYFAIGGLVYSFLFLLSVVFEIKIAKYLAEPLIFFFFFLALLRWYLATRM